MQFLIATLGSIGDLMPFLAVAEGLRARGHSCVVASNAGYAQVVQRTGFPFAAVWDRSQQSLDDILSRDPASAWRVVQEQMFVPATRPVFDFIAHFASRGESRILASWSAFGAVQAHRDLKLPLFSAYLSPQPLREHPPEARAIGFFPPWFSPGASGAALAGFPLFDDALIPPLPAELEAFLAARSAPVVFTPGSFMRGGHGFLRAALAACQALNRRALFLTPYAAQVPQPLPDFARHFSYINLQRLLPHAAAVVHHGGIGTAAQGLRAGIPQLVSPLFFDQPDNAACLEALGVGRRVDGADAEALRQALEMVLDNGTVRQACAAARAKFIAADPVGEICDLLTA